MSNSIYDKWERTRKIWAVMVLHQELDIIGVTLISMKTNIRIGEYNRALEEIDRAIFFLEDMEEKERFTIRNIL